MTSQIKGSWNEIKGKLKQRYAELTEDDLTFAEGKEDELLGRLQKRLGKSSAEIQHEIALIEEPETVEDESLRGASTEASAVTEADKSIGKVTTARRGRAPRIRQLIKGPERFVQRSSLSLRTKRLNRLLCGPL